MVSVGDKLPEGITLDYGFPPEKIKLAGPNTARTNTYT
jgi:hypothetical protein